MWVLHTHWQPPRRPADPGGILFWAESPQGPPPPPRGRPQPFKNTQIRDHPFCLEPDTIRLQIGSGTPLDSAQLGAVRLRLPSTNDSPLPSSDLNPEWELDDVSTPHLTAWLVRGLWLPAGKAFTVLSNLPVESTASGFVLGQDARYWQNVCSLVLEVLAEQRILPTLVLVSGNGRVPDQYIARWLPVLDSPKDGPRLALLEKSMPPICRAEMAVRTSTGKLIHQSIRSPRDLVDSFLKVMCDALARTWGRSRAPILLPEKGNILDIWLSALFSPDPRVKAPAGQLQSLHSSLRAWLRNLTAAGDEYYRIAFRLHTPDPQVEPGKDQKWLLEYMLQSRSDPSLLIPAEDLWTRPREEMAAYFRREEHPHDMLLAGLGFAARLFSPILTSLAARQPTGLDLDTQSAYTFLREAAPLLEQAGFAVLAPPWWNQRGARLGVRIHLRPREGKTAPLPAGKIGLHTLVRFEWEMSLGDTTLTRKEFESLVALKTPLVQIRGQWVQLDKEQVEAAIQFWEKQQHSGEMGLLEVAQLALGGQTAHGLPLDEVRAEGWISDWLDRLADNQRMVELAQPASLNGTLRPYQRFGFSWLAFFRSWGLGACLADDMGLGKTIQALALLLHEKESLGKLPGPVLLVCPTSVVTNWERETRRFAPNIKTLIHQGPDRLRDQKFAEAVKDTDLVLTSYALLRMDQESMQAVNWYGVILDEAQNIKNPAAKQSQAARSLKADFRLALTGTPVENRLTELWSIMQFLNPGYLGPLEKFRREFVIPIERFGDQEATTRLRQMIGPFILRRLKSDPRVIQDLPEKIETKEYCNLSEEQATLYEAIVQDSLKKVAESGGISRRGMVLAMLTHLKQICNHPAQFLKQPPSREDALAQSNGRSGKLNRLEEMLEEVLAEGDRALVFTQYAEMGHLLSAYLPQMLGCPVYYLHGGTPPRVRDQMVRRFQEEENAPPIFILSLKAGGLGLNLTRASHVFHFDRWWNPAVEDQATDRTYRIGQQQNVQVHKLITVGTLEERIDEMIESKKDLVQAVIGAGEDWITELSTDELRDLVALRR